MAVLTLPQGGFDRAHELDIAQWLEQVGTDIRRLPPSAETRLVMRRHDDGRNVESCLTRVILKAEAVHVRHLQIEDQAIGLTVLFKRSDKFARRWIGLH